MCELVCYMDVSMYRGGVVVHACGRPVVLYCSVRESTWTAGWFFVRGGFYFGNLLEMSLRCVLLRGALAG